MKLWASELAQSHANLAESYAELAQSNAKMAQAQAYLAQAQADTKKEIYRMMSNFEEQNQVLSRRQGEIVEILKTLANQPKK
jgi:hypothetical protein